MDSLEEILEEIEKGTADVRHADKLRDLLEARSYSLQIDEATGMYESVEWGSMDSYKGWILNQIVRPGKYQAIPLGKSVRLGYCLTPTCASCPHWIAMDRLCLRHAINVNAEFFCASHPDIENE